MNTRDEIEKLRQLSKDLGSGINSMVKTSEDYDLVRLLKKIEAQVMDVQHNLKLASRISESEE
jgi:hypothetical protein